MTRNLKKRLLALVLTLALCTALMLPGFAATANDDHYHYYVYSGQNTYVYEYGHREAGYHVSNVYGIYICSCGDRDLRYAGTAKISHPNPCTECGWYT